MKKKLTQFIRSHKKLVIFLSVLSVVTLSGCAYLWIKKPGSILNPEPERFFSKLTGRQVSKEVSERPILGVMIENSEEARPQTGLINADIVFETVTEGGITRYLALYQDDLPKNVGPVRSIRPAYVDWLMGFDASVAHVGGSPEALSTVNSRKAKSLNQFFNDGPYYRTNDRIAPHNMYANVEKLLTLMKEKGFTSQNVSEIARSNDQPAAEPTAKRITVTFSYDIFDTQYRYDKETNTYTRYLNGAVHKDAESKKAITVNNLIVIQQNGSIKGVGSGKAKVYKDGVVQDVQWEQKSFNERITLFTVVDGQRQETQINKGKTWFAVIPTDGTVKAE